MKKLGTFGVGSLLLTASTLLAINEPTSVPVPDTAPQLPATKGDAAHGSKSALLRQFQLANPGVRISQWENSRRIYGVPFGKAASPVAAAEQFRQQHAAMLGLNADNLVPATSGWREGGHVQPVMFDAAIGAYKFTAVYYEQQVDGVPVHGSRMTVLVRNDSNEIVLVNPDTRELDGFRPDARLLRNAQTAPAAKGKIRGQFGNLAIMQPERKVVWAGDSPNAKVTPRLADETLVVVGPAKYRVVTDAVTGDVLHTEDLICFGGITGNVSGLVTDGLGSEQCEPEVSKPLPYLEVTAGSNSTFTDANGDFSLPGGALSTNATLTGQWFEVFNFLGGVTSESTTSSPADLLFNSANTDPLVRAQVNAYFEANRVREFALSFNPAYPGLQFNQFPVTVNRTDGFCPG
ncbi:MAG: hypothetical protein KC983_04025, partial [Phycisphaerales bacterium]|nr:hypothetical protein [Phycisphaerales bacterium]